MLRIQKIHRYLAARTALLLLVVVATAEAQQKAPEEPVDMQWAVKIPLRDGVKLNATVFTPHAQKDTLPVIFTLTPYIGDTYMDRAVYFAKHGYVYALVDVRGRGNSGGSLNRLRTKARTATTWWNGWRSSPIAMAK